MFSKRKFTIVFILLAALTFSTLAPGTAEDQMSEGDPILVGHLTEDGIGSYNSAAGAVIHYQIYDQMGGSLLWEGETAANEWGYSGFSVFDTHVDLHPGFYLTYSNGTISKDLVLAPLTIDVLDAETNILTGTAAPASAIWIMTSANEWTCGADVVANESGDWLVDFDDYGCDIVEDTEAYAQIQDPEGDITETRMDVIWGSHDFNQDDVPSWACDVGGWAVDTDDRERDIHIRIWAGDELVIPDAVADGPIDYLVGVCGLDGTCGYDEDLWGLIEPNVTYVIKVEGYDLETGQWKQLLNEPHELTCRTQDIYTYDPGTGVTSVVAELSTTNEYNPSWSANGNYVAYDVVSLENVQIGISITNLTSGQTYPLAGAQEGGNDADWSPNGRTIVFDRAPMGDNSLYLVPSGGGTAQLFNQDAVSADFSPNGRRLVFQQPSDGSIRTLASNGRGRETIVAVSGANPAWSPDGDWIAYEKDDDIWKIGVDSKGLPTGDPIQVTNSPFHDHQPTWSADGLSIVFQRWLSDGGDIWTVPAEGGLPTWLTGGIRYGDYDPATTSGSAAVAYSSFTPNGQESRDWVAYHTYDMEPGYWTVGEHFYHFWSLGAPAGDPMYFTASPDEPIYDGWVLIRPYALRARVGEELIFTYALNPAQATRFHVGWKVDDRTYVQAIAGFDEMMVQISWDGGEPVEPLRHEIFPYDPYADRDYYFSFFTY